VWIVPRPLSERVPAKTHEIDIKISKPDGAPTVSLSVTSAAEVRRIVALIDAMPVTQPGATSCPALRLDGARLIAIEFRRHRRAPPLARAT
jgi:hypothetical protein